MLHPRHEARISEWKDENFFSFFLRLSHSTYFQSSSNPSRGIVVEFLSFYRNYSNAKLVIKMDLLKIVYGNKDHSRITRERERDRFIGVEG